MKKVSALLLLATVAPVASADLVFDSISPTGGVAPTFTGTGGAPHTLMGTALTLGNVGAGPIHVDGLDVAYRAYAAASYTNIRLDIMFFETATLATSGSSPAFSNLLFTRTVNTGTTTTAAGTRYTYQSATPGVTPGLALSPGFVLNDPTKPIGIQVLIRGDKGDGNGLVATDDLGLSLRYNVAPAVGSTPIGGTAGGFYRNASVPAPTTSSVLLGSDYRSLTGITDTTMALRLYATPVPEPASMVALGLGAAALLRRRRR